MEAERERKGGVEWNKGGKEGEREEGRSGVEQGREGGREGGRERETIIDAEGNVITYHFLLISLIQLQFR